MPKIKLTRRERLALVDALGILMAHAMSGYDEEHNFQEGYEKLSPDEIIELSDRLENGAR